MCLRGDDTIRECDRDSIIGYSATCSRASSFSVFSSAEVDCGDSSDSGEFSREVEKWHFWDWYPTNQPPVNVSVSEPNVSPYLQVTPFPSCSVEVQ